MDLSGREKWGNLMQPVERIAVVGGGIGGLTATIALARQGFEVEVFEQAQELIEVGAGLTLSPNAVKVFRALGIEEEVRAKAFEPQVVIGRDLIAGGVTSSVDLSSDGELRFGAVLHTMLRSDLQNILVKKCNELGASINLANRCTDVSANEDHASLTLSDGAYRRFDLVVGCDGIHSCIRARLHGADAPRFTGYMCWRAMIAGPVEPVLTIWTGAGGHVLVYNVRGDGPVNIVANRKAEHWIEEAWAIRGEPAELMHDFRGSHNDLLDLLEQVQECYRWGLFDRDPLPEWSKGRITLLGDAAHPTLPFLGQGAAMAIEDAFALARAMARDRQNFSQALQEYEHIRMPRTTRIQLASRAEADALHRAAGAQVRRDWVYDYDITQAEPPKRTQ
jgi:salicylate hydroxylase